MRLFGFEISRSKAAPPVGSYDRGRSWLPMIREPFTGAWQRNMEERSESILTYHAVYACITRIASDVAKCRIRLVERTKDGIWVEVENASYSPVLRKPNDYQNRIQFFESWMVSKLTTGNTYVLKVRDNRGGQGAGNVRALYVLDPNLVRVLVAPDGSVWYQLNPDNLSGVEQSVTVPASEIIHDMTTLRHHPLQGVPPLAPAALAATHGLNIQRNSVRLFKNGSQPGGILVAPENIDEADVKRIKELWEQNMSGENYGRIAVLGSGFDYKKLAATANEAQLVEQLGLSGTMVCSSFGVPPHMVGIGDPPQYNNIEALNRQYYVQCLQKEFEAIELLLDEGIGVGLGNPINGRTYGTEFDLDDLLRMDTAALVKTLTEGLKGVYASNEARLRVNLPPVAGGDAVLSQQQNFSLEALAKRDAKEDPFGKSADANPPAPQPVDQQQNSIGKLRDEIDDLAARQKAVWELEGWGRDFKRALAA